MNLMKPQIMKGLTLVTITQEECCVWRNGLIPNTAPLRVHPKVASAKKKFHNVREDQTHRGHGAEKFGKEFLEEISRALVDTQEFLLITHGSGKSNALGAFTEYVNSHHPELAKKMSVHIEADLTNLTDAQILALARDWSQAHIS